jgi:hypothetical protein
MSRIRADRIVDRAATGAPLFPNGAVVTGVTTATTFDGNATTATTATNAQGLTGTPNITVGSINGTTATFTGLLTYEDVANVDAVGVITARAGADLNGYKVEEGLADGTGLNGLFNFELDNGHFQKYHGATAGNYEPNFRVSASQTLNSVMDVGDVTSATLAVISSSHYLDGPQIQIDGSTSNITTHYIGGSAPSSANGSGYDIYSFTIQKTAATPAWYIIVNATSAAV